MDKHSKVKTNSWKAWFLAARPKTLSGAIVPVAIALALSLRDLHSIANAYGSTEKTNAFQCIPAILCLLFACFMQIDANLVNDYFDCKRGIDAEDRLGPERACSQGWITLPAMKKALILVTIISALIGLPLIFWGGWTMILVGLACIVFCYLYTTLLSGKAMGDVLVLVFFGIVPVCATYYLQTGEVTSHCLLLSIGCGLATDNLLIVNNFRDRETDKRHGKTTLVTLIGEQATLWLYLILGLAAITLAYIVDIKGNPLGLDSDLQLSDVGQIAGLMLMLLYAVLLYRCHKKMRTIRVGRALNQVLGKTALSILIYGISVCLLVLF